MFWVDKKVRYIYLFAGNVLTLPAIMEEYLASSSQGNTSIMELINELAAKLDAASGGAVVPGWAPDPDDFAVTFDVHGSHVYIGGWFSNIGGQAIKGLARADLGSGVIDPTWDPQVDDRVYIVEADDPHIFAGGEFLNAGGQARRRLAKIALADASIESWNPGANDFPRTLLVEGSDLYVGGTFTEMGGLGRNRLARVDVSTGSVDPVWNPDVDNPIDFYADWEVIDPGECDNAFKVQWELYLRHVAEGAEFPWTLREGAKGVQLAELSLQSHAEGKWIAVE